MSDFNVMDLSQKIMGSVDPHELEQLGQSLQSGNIDIGSMYTMLSNMISFESEGDGEDGMDIGSMLSSMLPPGVRY